ncbi:MAG: S8 family serine peptidase, partial [Lachnospiraceae bacterium]|nr:S8 family serine peptidase [Candidatus Hippenecus merdae]
MKKFKEYLALLLACAMTVCACAVYGASRGLLPETSVPEDTFVYEETEDFVPGEVIVCVAGGAETLAEDMAAAESTGAPLLGASGTDVAAAKEAVSLYTCSLTAEEAAAASGGVTAEVAVETLLGASGEAEMPSEILLLHTEEGKEQEAIDFLCTLPHVEFAEPNYLYAFTDYTGTDPAFRGEGSRFVTSPSAWEQQWAYNGTGDYGMGEAGIPIWKDKRVNAPVNPETEEYDKDQIVVALMDTGVDYNNPEIRPVLWNCPEDMQETLGCGEFGFDAVAANGGPGDPTDPIDDIVGHGTHCAGIIGASWKDGGIYGIANNVKIMAVRIGREDIKGSDALTGFNFVKKTVENGVNVAAINNSWGGSYSGHAIERAVLELGKLGTLTLFAAGNDGSDNDVRNDTTCTFTSDPYVVVVDSHNEAGELSAFSNYGLKTTHISAPGESILSAAAAVRASIDPKDPENYEPCLDDTTKESYFAPMDHVTIASAGEKEARENAFCFRGEKLATASTASLDVLDDPAENVHLKTESTLTEDGIPCADLIVDLSEADLPGEDGLFFGFRLTKAGWDTGMAPDFDELTLSITAEYPDGTQKKMFDKTYNIAYGKPFAVSAPAVTDADHYRIRVLLKRFDAQTENFVPVDPGFAAFDDFLFTGKCSAYVSMSGTSMACPAVTGEAVVLAAKFARMPSGTRAKELQARIIGSAVPFANEEDKDKNRTGGYANLVKAMEEDYDPVIQSASFDSETGLLTLDGYFFPNVEKAAAEGWYVMLDNTKITDITWSEDGKTAVFAMGGADLGSKEYAIRILAKKSEKSGRNFLWIDTGALADGFMPRLDISGTDAEMY